MLIYYVRETGGEGQNYPLPVPSALFFILESPLPLSLSLFFSYFLFFFGFCFFVFCVMLPSPGKIDGPEGFKRIKRYPNAPKTF